MFLTLNMLFISLEREPGFVHMLRTRENIKNPVPLMKKIPYSTSNN